MTNAIMDGGFEYLRPYLTGINLNKITKTIVIQKLNAKFAQLKIYSLQFKVIRLSNVFNPR